MSLAAQISRAAERAPLPDTLLRFGISRLVGRTQSQLALSHDRNSSFAQEMAARAIAEHTAAANQQHYELPPEFFAQCLGPRRKYSCCLFEGTDNLVTAERRALGQTAANAELQNGQRILELGCGWGSLTLFMAERFPEARITAVSNSASQRLFIEAETRRLGLRNIRVITADMNVFNIDETFDRIVSVEMFEHMANWRGLLTRLRSWMAPEARLFLHVFSHASQPYRFEVADEADWIAQYFFTGGIMPSHDLIHEFNDLFRVEHNWRWNGKNYEQTALAWLANYDANQPAIRAILGETYGVDAKLWQRRWRLFFLATAGLFGHAGGEAWGVSHYLLRPCS
jgi:cyclopropane-fatty-acyl-phospholipid synthase